MNFGWHRSGEEHRGFSSRSDPHRVPGSDPFLLAAEILGAVISVMSIWIVTGVLVYLAIERIVHDDYEIIGHVMLITSGCAVIVNIM